MISDIIGRIFRSTKYRLESEAHSKIHQATSAVEDKAMDGLTGLKDKVIGGDSAESEEEKS